MVAHDTGGDEQAINARGADAWNAAMDELLGPDGKRLLEDYSKYADVRSFFDALVTGGSQAKITITPEQSDQLLQLALANDPVYQSGRRTNPSNVNWEAVWEAAAKILAPDQLATLQTMIDWQSLKDQLQAGLAAAAK
jgi:hypothetical protein